MPFPALPKHDGQLEIIIRGLGEKQQRYNAVPPPQTRPAALSNPQPYNQQPYHQQPPAHNKPPPPPPQPAHQLNSQYPRPSPPNVSNNVYNYPGSPPPQNYGFGPPPQHHDRSPPASRPPQTTATPGQSNQDASLFPLFKAVDKKGTGHLTEKELRAALVNGDFTSFDPHTVKMMIRMFDADKSGTIGFDEFCRLWAFLASWRSLFDRFDEDRSGYISFEEYSNALVAFGYRLSSTFVNLLYRTYEKNGNNRMSFDLFVQSCIVLKRMTDVFKKYDEDRDGYITMSFEEFLTAPNLLKREDQHAHLEVMPVSLLYNCEPDLDGPRVYLDHINISLHKRLQNGCFEIDCTACSAVCSVPGSSQRMLDKSRGLTVDCVAYDLEDSVTPGKKTEARANIRHVLQQPRSAAVKENAVRINAVQTGLALDDLTEVLKAPNIDTIIVPKVSSPSDLNFVTDVIRHALPQRHTEGYGQSGSPPFNILALVESAKAVMDLSSICKASPYLSGLIFAAEDFALDLSLTRTPSLMEFLFARSAIATACRAYNLPSTIDLVCTAYNGVEGQQRLEEECLGGKGLGFNGKQCIHPSQVEVVQKAFAPSEDELRWAVQISVAARKADQQGRGAWTLNGQMIDAPVVGKATSIVSKAEVCGMDVASVHQKWKDQEPE
ncbi:MAG: hypothetical protein Q9181_002736 [Wetmoreana brouardii]